MPAPCWVLRIQQWHKKWSLPQAAIAFSWGLFLLTFCGSWFSQERDTSSNPPLYCPRGLILLGGDWWVPKSGPSGWTLSHVPTSYFLPPEGSDSSSSHQAFSNLGLFCRQRVAWVCNELHIYSSPSLAPRLLVTLPMGAPREWQLLIYGALGFCM